MRVPFFHWRLGSPRDAPADDPWGPAVSIQGFGGFHVAVASLIEALRPQFVVWIEGLHRPGEIELSADAPAGLRIAGAAGDPSVERALSAGGSRRSRRANPGAAG
jgi:hypothetical protein